MRHGERAEFGEESAYKNTGNYSALHPTRKRGTIKNLRKIDSANMNKLLTLSLISLLVASLCKAKVVLPESVDEQENDLTDILDEALELSKALGPEWAVEPLPSEEELDTAQEPEEAQNDTEAVVSRYLGWYNTWDAAFDFRCPHTYEGIYRIRSMHDNHKEDRLFQFDCRRVCRRVHASCRWSDYVNTYDQKVDFNCGANKYIGGMGSIHSNRHEDRRWKFFCCGQSGLRLGHCFKTFWTNDWDQTQDFVVPHGYILTGVRSYHDNHKEDRRFAYTFCHRRVTS